MTVTRRILLATAFAAALAMPALAAEPYITSKTLDLTVLLPPPPAKGSAEDKADMLAVLDAQAKASDARKALALADSEQTAYAMFTSVLGDKFTAVQTPVAAAFFARIGASDGATLNDAKPFFGRVRPWIANPDVKAIAEPTKSGGYPSGHVTRAAIDAIMMADVVPEKKAEIWARAREYAESRVIGGMHYRTDLDSGWRAGTAMAAVMLQDPAFRADLAAAKAEIRAALGL